MLGQDGGRFIIRKDSNAGKAWAGYIPDLVDVGPAPAILVLRLAAEHEELGRQRGLNRCRQVVAHTRGHTGRRRLPVDPHQRLRERRERLENEQMDVEIEQMDDQRGCVACSRLWVDTVSVRTSETENFEVQRPQIVKAGPGINSGAPVAPKEPGIFLKTTAVWWHLGGGTRFSFSFSAAGKETIFHET
jgi:hypothetical protein